MNTIKKQHKQVSLSIFGKSIIAIAKFDVGGWMRVFGFGISWKPKSEGLIFSERIGKKPYLKIGKWVFSYLPPAPI